MSAPGLLHPPTIVLGPKPSIIDESTFIQNQLYEDTKFIGSGAKFTVKLTYSRVRPNFTWRNCEFTHRVHPLTLPANDPAYLAWPGEPTSINDLYASGVPSGPPGVIVGTGKPDTAIRANGTRNWLIENCHFRWTHKEHGFYHDEIGPLTIVRFCLFDHCGGQGLQQVLRDMALPTTSTSVPPVQQLKDMEGLTWIHDNRFEHCGLAAHGLGRANVQCRLGPSEVAGLRLHPSDVLLEDNVFIHDHGAGTWYSWAQFGSGGTPGAFMIERRRFAVARNNIVNHTNQSGKGIAFFKFNDWVVVEGNTFNGGQIDILYDWADADPKNILWRNNTGSPGKVSIRDIPAGAQSSTEIASFNITDDFILLNSPVSPGIITPTTNFGTWPIFGHAGAARGESYTQSPIVVTAPTGGSEIISPAPAEAWTQTIGSVGSGSLTIAPRKAEAFTATVLGSVQVTGGSHIVEPPPAEAFTETVAPFVEANILIRTVDALTTSHATGPNLVIDGIAPATAFPGTVAPTVELGSLIAAPFSAEAFTATPPATVNVTGGNFIIEPPPAEGFTETTITPALTPLTLTPAPAEASTATVAPRVSSPVVPAPAEGFTEALGQALLGSLTIAPPPVQATPQAVWPTQVVLGGQVAAPAPAEAFPSPLHPTVHLGGATAVTPAPASAGTSSTFGQVELGSIALTPAPTEASTATEIASAFLGSVTIAPVAARGATATAGPTVGTSDIVEPAPAEAWTETVGPNVSGQLIAEAWPATSAPTVVLTGLVATPAPAFASTATAGPLVTVPQATQVVVAEARDFIRIDTGQPLRPTPPPIIFEG